MCHRQDFWCCKDPKTIYFISVDISEYSMSSLLVKVVGLILISTENPIGCIETVILVVSSLVVQESPIESRGAVGGFFSQCDLLAASLLGGLLYDKWFPFALFGGFFAILLIWGLVIFFLTQN